MVVSTEATLINLIMSEYNFYHGTSTVFNIKRDIIPPDLSGNKREEFRQKFTNVVFTTNSLISAISYAHKATNKYGGEPIVYKCKPIGDVINIVNNEYISNSALVLGVVEI